MEFEKKDTRSEERYPFLKTIRYACLPDFNQDLKGVTIDISKSGLSLYIFSTCCIVEGQHIKIKDKLPVSSQGGTVKWVRQVDQDLYRAGLSLH